MQEERNTFETLTLFKILTDQNIICWISKWNHRQITNVGTLISVAFRIEKLKNT